MVSILDAFFEPVMEVLAEGVAGVGLSCDGGSNPTWCWLCGGRGWLGEVVRMARLVWLPATAMSYDRSLDNAAISFFFFKFQMLL